MRLSLWSQLQYMAAMRQETSPAGRFAFTAGTVQRRPPALMGVAGTPPQNSGGIRCGRRSSAGRSKAALKKSSHWALVTSMRPIL